MPRKSSQSPHTSMPIPADDLNRTLTIAQPDNDGKLLHLGIVGDTYTILLTGGACGAFLPDRYAHPTRRRPTPSSP